MRLFINTASFWILVLSLVASAKAATNGTPPAPSAKPDHWTDEQGNYYRRASTGHVTNYDEAKAGTYTLPDPLVLRSGRKVKDREVWENQRRAEILELYRNEIYGREPPSVPPVRFEVLETDPNAFKGAAIRKHIVAHFSGPGKPEVAVHLQLYVPAAAKGASPVLLHLLFNTPPDFSAPHDPAGASKPMEAGPLEEFLARGYAYAIFRYTEVEPDGGKISGIGVRNLAGDSASGDRWGAISAWAWGASRMLDYLETEPGVDSRRVALIGHSRLGKTVLWAGAQDRRFALIFSSCAGEMGSSLARRDYGETVDDMAAGFGGQFAPNFKKYAGHWNDLPVDAHFLIALNAPRPVLITGGTKDQWADPRGEFLAEVAAGPVYRLLGKQDLGRVDAPEADVPVISGDLGYYYHTGGHAITAADWKVFLDFADARLRL